PNTMGTRGPDSLIARGSDDANGRKRNRHLVLRETPRPSPQIHMQLLPRHGRIGVVQHDALLRVPLCSPDSPVEKANPGAVPLLSKTSCHAAQAVGGEQEAGHGGAAPALAEITRRPKRPDPGHPV